MRRAGLAIALLAAGCGSNAAKPAPAKTATAAAPTVAATVAASRCDASDLAATVHFGEGAAAAGHIQGALLLENRSTSACTLHGYPGLSFVDDAGQQVGASATRSGASTIPTVTLAPGRQAGAELEIVDVGVYDPSACKPADAKTVKVYPPGSYDAIETARTTRVCRGKEKVATIGPMEALGDLPAGLL